MDGSFADLSAAAKKEKTFKKVTWKVKDLISLKIWFPLKAILLSTNWLKWKKVCVLFLFYLHSILTFFVCA